MLNFFRCAHLVVLFPRLPLTRFVSTIIRNNRKFLFPSYRSMSFALNNFEKDVQSILQEIEQLYYREKFQEALELGIKTREYVMSNLGSLHPANSTLLNNIGLMHKSLGNFTEAIESYNEAIRVSKANFGSTWTVANIINNKAQTYQILAALQTESEAQNTLKKALESFEEAYQIRRKSLSPQNPLIMSTENNLAIIYFKLGRKEEAEKLLNSALKALLKTVGERHPTTATTFNNLGYIYRNLGKYHDALEFYTRAKEIRNELFGPNHNETIIVDFNISTVHRALGNDDIATEIEESILKIAPETNLEEIEKTSK